MPQLKNKKHEMFCIEYVIDFNGARAARAAKYSEKSAKRQASLLIKREDINERIDELRAERVKQARIDGLYVLLSAKELHERCMQRIEPVLNKTGEQVYEAVENEEGDKEFRPVYKFDSAGAAKALEIIGKHVDVNAFKVITENVTKIEDVTDDELEKRIKSLIEGR